MSQIANLVAFDGAATPVSHTFTPISVTREKKKVTALYRETGLAVPMNAQPRVIMTNEELPNSNVNRVDIRVEVPVMEAVNGQNAAGYTAAPKVAFTDTMILTGYFSPRSQTANRRLIRQLLLNVAGSIATSVAPASTGPAPELVDLSVSPT